MRLLRDAPSSAALDQASLGRESPRVKRRKGFFGDLYVARSPFSEPEPVPLPVELRAAMESPFANVRAGAVEELARLFVGADARLAAAARVALDLR